MHAPLRGKTSLVSILLLIAASPLTASPVTTQEHAHPAADASTLGEVEFPSACGPDVQPAFNRAVAMLHSFWYQAAEHAFREIAAKAPDCAMAHWGVGMSRFHQLWEGPTPEDVRVGRRAFSAASMMRGFAGEPAREDAYVAALGEIFAPTANPDYRLRKLAYERRMEALYEAHPEDPEAAIFYALSLLGSAASSPPDSTYARQRKARAILEEVLADHPDHPGVTHYIIHGTDYPELAPDGLDAARRYAEIAPDAPHALHMPTHIFTRLGLWKESIDSNLRAAAAARRENWTGEELHASDYLVYAYMQVGNADAARAIVDSLSQRQAHLQDDDPNYPAGIYALAAIPARFWIEQRRWNEAAVLDLPDEWFPSDRYCWAEATLDFTRGLGAAYTGDADGAREDVAALFECEHALRAAGQQMWADRMFVNRRILESRLLLDAGDAAEAVAVLRAAADLEDRSDKPPITPGSVLPARESLGELLLALDRPADALAAFEASLENSPRRRRSLQGAATAARTAGLNDAAERYEAELAELGQ